MTSRTASPTRRPFGLRVAAVSAIALASMVLVTGCANWWVGQYPPTPTPTGGALSSADASFNLSDVATLGVTTADLVKSWNAAAAKLGSDVILPDPLVADDTVDGLATSTLSFGDSTIVIQWQDATDEVTLVQLDGPAEGDVATSGPARATEVIVAGVAGLPAAEARSFADKLVSTAVEGAVSSEYLEASDTVGSASVDFSVLSGAATVLVTPAS